MSRDQKTKIVIIAVIILLIGGYIITKCNDDNVQSTINNVEIEDNKVNEIALSMVPVKTLNPLVSTDEDTFYLSKLIYSSLYTFDENMTPEGDLAKSYSFSGNSVTITLKSAKWQDGKSVSGDDVEFTIKAIKSIGSSSLYYEKVDKIKSVSADGNKVKITFKSEDDMSLSYLSFPIVPEHEYKSVSEFVKDVDDFVPEGSGMYNFVSYDPSTDMILEKNESYYGEKAVSDIKVKVVKTDSNVTKMTESSNVTVFLDKSANRSTKITKKNILIQNFTGNQVEFIGFNFNNELLQNVQLRKAIACAIDIDNIIEEEYYNSAVKSDSLYYPKYLGSTDAADDYIYDVDKAVKILKEEKYTDTNDDNILDSTDGESLKFTLIVNSDDSTRVEVANAIKSYLKEVNIDVEVSELSSDAYKSTLASGNFDMYVGGMTLDASVDLRPLLMTGGEYNYINYSSDTVDKYLTALMSGQTNEENTSTMNDLKEELNDQLPYYAIGYRTFGIVESPAFNGTIKATFANPYRGIENWYCVYEKRIVEDDTSDEDSE